MRNKIFFLSVFFLFIFQSVVSGLPAQIFFFPNFLTYDSKEVTAKVLREYGEVKEKSVLFFVFPKGDSRDPQWMVEKFILGVEPPQTEVVELSLLDEAQLGPFLGEVKVGGVHFLPELFFSNLPDWKRHHTSDFLGDFFTSNEILEKRNRIEWKFGQRLADQLIFGSQPSSVNTFLNRALSNADRLVFTFGFCDKFVTPQVLHAFSGALFQALPRRTRPPLDILMYNASGFLNSEIGTDLKSTQDHLSQVLWSDRWKTVKSFFTSPIWLSRKFYKEVQKSIHEQRLTRLQQEQKTRAEIDEALKKYPTLKDFKKGFLETAPYAALEMFYYAAINPFVVALPSLFVGTEKYQENLRLYQDKLSSIATLPQSVLYSLDSSGVGKVLARKDEIFEALSPYSCVSLLLESPNFNITPEPSSFDALGFN